MAGIGLELHDHAVKQKRYEIIGRGIEAGIVDIAAESGDLERALAAEALGRLGWVVEIIINIGAGNRRFPGDAF